MALKKFIMSVTEEMYKALEQETRKRKLPSIQETVRQIIAEAF